MSAKKLKEQQERVAQLEQRLKQHTDAHAAQDFRDLATGDEFTILSGWCKLACVEMPNRFWFGYSLRYTLINEDGYTTQLGVVKTLCEVRKYLETNNYKRVIK